MTTISPTPLVPGSDPPRPAAAWAAQRPEPSRFWLRYRPRTWPPAELAWSDLGMAVLRDGVEGSGDSSLPAELDPAPAGSAADTVYLPPVPGALEPERQALASRIAAAGTPVLLQVLVGGELPPASAEAPAGERLTRVYDPLPLLLGAGRGPALAALHSLAPPAGSALVWPLVPGFSDGEPSATAAALLGAGLAARFLSVQPLALDLSPAQRRTLAEGQEAAVYDALFHRPPPAERPLVQALGTAAAPAPFLPRPLPDGPAAGNRQIAGALALAAELWLRLGRSPAAGQALYRAARWVDETDRDLAALAREGNLGVLPALDERACRVAAAAAVGEGYPPLVRELLDEYRSGGTGDATA